MQRPPELPSIERASERGEHARSEGAVQATSSRLPSSAKCRNFGQPPTTPIRLGKSVTHPLTQRLPGMALRKMPRMARSHWPLQGRDSLCYNRQGASSAFAQASGTTSQKPGFAVRRKRGLTLRSRRGPTASHQAREAERHIIFLAGLASCRRSRLTSNVRPRRTP